MMAIMAMIARLMIIRMRVIIACVYIYMTTLPQWGGMGGKESLYTPGGTSAGSRTGGRFLGKVERSKYGTQSYDSQKILSSLRLCLWNKKKEDQGNKRKRGTQCHAAQLKKV